MDSTKSGQDQQIRCANCGQMTPGYEIVNYGSMESGYRQVCNRCLNAEMAKTNQRYKAEQIVNLLRKIEVEIANGKTTVQASREVGSRSRRITASGRNTEG
jgi:hypothetical protein